MALSAAIREATNRTASRLNRWRQIKAERRIDELMAVESIGTTYTDIDRAGDVLMETHFQRIFDAADDDEERTIAADAYAAWMKVERNEEVHVIGRTEEVGSLMRDNNDLFLSDGCGPDGRAA